MLWADSQGHDVTVCFISSQSIDQISPEEVALTPEDSSFSQTGLKVASKIKIRVTKIVTIECRLLQRRLGRLADQHLQAFNQVLKLAFQLE
ncbi:type II toxin-antitoxin system PemK/MazF family toxin [Synechocystis sp. B12]|nr:type II toxin-antitoxin system PemK/MazF family toxin [Synechocystis sp. B12]